MTSLRSDIVKRVERLPKPSKASEAMIPLFEAISNSIHSTIEKFDDEVSDKGEIIVDITIPKKDKLFKASVVDNGLGLNEKNYNAFITTDTDNKITIGGKGVGRLLWLDSFENISVHSTFLKDGGMKFREFEFCLSNDEQILGQKTGDASHGTPSTGVTVNFSGLKDNEYKEKFPNRAAYAFQYIASHFLAAFINEKSPKMTVTINGDSKQYPQEIASFVFREQIEEKIETADYGDMRLVMMECDKLLSSDLKGNHFIHFIAHDRTVVSQKIDGKLGIKYFGEGQDRAFHACLYGGFLDKNVNQERTSFVFEDSVIESIINKVCIEYVEAFLSEPLAKHKDEQKKVVQQVISEYPSVSFGDVKELQGHLPSGELHDDAIYGHLSRERFRRDQKQKEKIRDALKKMKEGQFDAESFNTAIKEATGYIEAAEQKSLAEYVIRRKIVIDFIEVLLQKFQDDEKDSSFQREDLLHSFICPMRINTTKDQGRKVAPASSHDLWLVDERLTFAQYFSSDAPFNELAQAYDSEERPDLLLFDKVHGLRERDNGSKVLLVEFKRPGRTSYADNENPQQQVERYIRRLLDNKELDVKGRPINLSKESTVFHCYIVADIVGKLDEWTYSWSPTYDGRGRLYQPSSGFNGYIELIGWDTLIDDARERNQAFFDKAGLGTDNYFEQDE